METNTKDSTPHYPTPAPFCPHPSPNPLFPPLKAPSLLLCSGMLAKDTICAEMAFMLMERNREGSTIDYPMGGTSSIVDALSRGIEKHGGKIMLRSHVEEILVEGV